MLSPKTQYNLSNARSYFSEHLCVGDYYSENERVHGEWLGTGAQMLGLSGAVEQEQFIALCENRNPQTAERLTLRNKTTRNDGEREVANRRVFYDFTLSPPKSVSVAALVVCDEQITAAHASAVRTAMKELERYAATQVHAGRNHCDRTTGNFIAALFQHDTSRALDPHLHTHCIVFNATHDITEQRWKALQNHGMLSAQKFVENVYYHELAQELLRLGYSVVNNARGDFELAEIPVKVRECFSKRHQEIDAKTAALLANHSDKAEGNIADIREHIAHKDRGRTLPPLPKEKLRTFWRSQMSAADLTKETVWAAIMQVGHTPRIDEIELLSHINHVTSIDHEGNGRPLIAVAPEESSKVTLDDLPTMYDTLMHRHWMQGSVRALKANAETMWVADEIYKLWPMTSPRWVP